jgi:hypothetical protein
MKRWHLEKISDSDHAQRHVAISLHADGSGSIDIFYAGKLRASISTNDLETHIANLSAALLTR